MHVPQRAQPLHRMRHISDPSIPWQGHIPALVQSSSNSLMANGAPIAQPFSFMISCRESVGHPADYHHPGKLDNSIDTAACSVNVGRQSWEKLCPKLCRHVRELLVLQLARVDLFEQYVPKSASGGICQRDVGSSLAVCVLQQTITEPAAL